MQVSTTCKLEDGIRGGGGDYTASLTWKYLDSRTFIQRGYEILKNNTPKKVLTVNIHKLLKLIITIHFLLKWIKVKLLSRVCFNCFASSSASHWFPDPVMVLRPAAYTPIDFSSLPETASQTYITIPWNFVVLFPSFWTKSKYLQESGAFVIIS